jgi:hypothetical protein
MVMMTIVGAVKVDVGEEESGYGRGRGCENHAHVIWGIVRFIIIASRTSLRSSAALIGSWSAAGRTRGGVSMRIVIPILISDQRASCGLQTAGCGLTNCTCRAHACIFGGLIMSTLWLGF